MTIAALVLLLSTRARMSSFILSVILNKVVAGGVIVVLLSPTPLCKKGTWDGESGWEGEEGDDDEPSPDDSVVLLSGTI